LKTRLPHLSRIGSFALLLLTAVLSGCGTSNPQGNKEIANAQPGLAITPASLSFGSQTLNSTVSKIITIQNNGNADLVLKAASLSGSAAFQLKSWSGTATVPASGQLQLTLDFTPVQAGPAQATLSMETNASVNPSVTLSGSGTNAASTSGSVTVSISPQSASLSGMHTQQFSATVSGSSNKAVSWSVNGVSGGDATAGTISSTGLYSAPACSSQTSVSVSARSEYDTAVSAAATVKLSPAGPANGQYYVSNSGNDGNDGSACHPWASIAHADSKVGPGAVVWVEPGTYAGPISTRTSGTASSTIQYISQTQFGAVIECTGICDMVWTQTGSYVAVKGFNITSSDPNTRIGIEWQGAHGSIQGNKVHDIQCSGCVGNGGAGINVDNGSAYTIADSNIVNNIDFSGKGGAASLYVHGIYVHTFYNVISNNLVYNCAGWGVEQGHEVSNSTIVNNTIFECGGGVMLGTGGSSGTSNNNVINNNILVYNGPGYSGHGYGIDAIQNYGDDNSITDNLLYGNKPSNINPALSGAATNSGSITNVDPNSNTIFVDWQSNGEGNYELKTGSPAIHTGTNISAPLFDINGGPRPWPAGGHWDLGAYQYGSPEQLWPWSH
jgi:Abnormal spindle-like microcephaly-assoc'd, ASPM-SPD-2-Hydin/Right handed beta helix region